MADRSYAELWRRQYANYFIMEHSYNAPLQTDSQLSLQKWTSTDNRVSLSSLTTMCAPYSKGGKVII